MARSKEIEVHCQSVFAPTELVGCLCIACLRRMMRRRLRGAASALALLFAVFPAGELHTMR